MHFLFEWPGPKTLIFYAKSVDAHAKLVKRAKNAGWKKVECDQNEKNSHGSLICAKFKPNSMAAKLPAAY